MRREGNSKLVYDKKRHTIIVVKKIVYRKFLYAIKPSNIVNLGLARLMRSKSPWDSN